MLSKSGKRETATKTKEERAESYRFPNRALYGECDLDLDNKRAMAL